MKAALTCSLTAVSDDDDDNKGMPNGEQSSLAVGEDGLEEVTLKFPDEEKFTDSNGNDIWDAAEPRSVVELELDEPSFYRVWRTNGELLLGGPYGPSSVLLNHVVDGPELTVLVEALPDPANTMTLLPPPAVLILGATDHAPRPSTSWDALRLRGMPKPTVSIAASDATATEDGDPGEFTLTRSGAPNTVPLTVKLQWEGTATSGTDYDALSTTVTVPADSDSTPFSVTAIADELPETDELVTAVVQPDDEYEVASDPGHKAWVTILGRNGFVDGGNTGDNLIFWVIGPGGGGRGNELPGSVEDEKGPVIETGVSADGLAWARVKEGTGLIRVNRSYTGILAGDQGVGIEDADLEGSRVFISEMLAPDLNAHEQGHVDASEKVYAQTVAPAAALAATYRSQKLMGNPGETEAQVWARLESLLDWSDRIAGFQQQDPLVNSGAVCDFHTWETQQGGGPTANTGGGTLGGIAYDIIYRTRRETEAGYVLPDYSAYSPPPWP